MNKLALVTVFGLISLSAGCGGEMRAAVRNYAEANLTSAQIIQTSVGAITCDGSDSEKAKVCAAALETIKKEATRMERDSQDLKTKAQ